MLKKTAPDGNGNGPHVEKNGGADPPATPITPDTLHAAPRVAFYSNFGEVLTGRVGLEAGYATTILGRIAAYEGRTVTWDEMMKANKKMELNLKL